MSHRDYCMAGKRFSIIVLALISCPAAAETPADSIITASDTRIAVTIRTNIEGAHIYLDSDSIGIAPVTVWAAPGPHRLKLIPPDVENWLSEPIGDSIHVGKTPQTFEYAFERKILLTSFPTGAEVFTRDSLLGTTPLILTTRNSNIRIRKKGFADQPVDILEAKRGILTVRLEKMWESDGDDLTYSDTEEHQSPLRLYLTGAATIISGATAAYFKVKADNTYSQYVRNGEPSQLSAANKLDTSAGIALVATQISLGLFTYFILSE